MRQLATVALIGLAIGVPVALATGPLFGAVLYGVAPGDPRVVVGAALVMAAVVTGAALLPALRATRIDALAALRSE